MLWCHPFLALDHIFRARWEPFINGWGLSYAAPLPCNHLSGIPITSGLIDVRFIKVNEPTGHLLSSRSSTGDDRQRGQKTYDKKAARADLARTGGGEKKAKRGDKEIHCQLLSSLPPFLLSSLPAIKDELSHHSVFFPLSHTSCILFMAFIFQLYGSIYGGYIYGIWLTALNRLCMSNKS